MAATAILPSTTVYSSSAHWQLPVFVGRSRYIKHTAPPPPALLHLCPLSSNPLSPYPSCQALCFLQRSCFSRLRLPGSKHIFATLALCLFGAKLNFPLAICNLLRCFLPSFSPFFLQKSPLSLILAVDCRAHEFLQFYLLLGTDN